MLSKMTKKQIIAESSKIRRELGYSRIDNTQKEFVKKFIKKNRNKLYFIGFLAFIETLIGISLPTISHFYLEKSFDLMNYRTFLLIGITLLCLTGIYLVNTYYRIYIGERLIMSFVNRIREAWYIYYLKHSVAFKKSFDGKRLMTKFVYHIQLLRMGAQNVILQILQSSLLYIGILIFSLLFNPKLFLVLWLSAPLFIIIFLIADYIGKYYVSREQTFNTRIVMQLADSLINFDIFKLHGREDEKIKEMENLIDLDTYFRVRRQLWIKYSNRVMYSVILVFGILLYFVQIYWPFIDFYSVTNVAATAIILSYFTRILFSLTRIGIFFEALRLGLQLSIPTFNYKVKKAIKEVPSWKTIRIHSKKTKLSKYGDYLKNFEFNIEKGERISIMAGDSFGKTTLARAITGQKKIESLIFNLNKKRFSSTEWCRFKQENCFISGNPTFDTVIGEYLLGKSAQSITREDVDKIFQVLTSHKIFDFIINHKDFLGRKISTHDLSFTEIILLQIAHCILNEKSIISIDHTCIDHHNKAITKGIKLLEQEFKKSTIIVFSTEHNEILSYDKTFHLRKAEFVQV